MAIPPSPTSSLSSDEEEIAFSTVSRPQEEDTLFVQGRLVAIVMDYIVKLSSEPDQVIGLLDTPEDSDSSNDDFRNLFKVLVSGIQDLRAFFSVPNNQIMSNITPIPNPNEVVAAFIDFLLQILLEILRIEPDFIVSVKASIKLLRRELEFLITFLGDTPMTLQPTEVEETNDILTDIQFVVNEVGSFLYSLLYNWHDQVIGILGLALSDLLSKFELLKTQIKEYCITVSKFPSCITPNTCVVSLFIVDSLLDDLNHLINHKADTIVGVNDQIATLHEEIMLLRTSVMEIVVQQQTEPEELVIRTRDSAYEVEYVINSFPPFWYLAMRLPQLIEKIKLIRMAIQEMKNNIDEAGMPKVAKYPGEEVSLQSKETRILEDVVVGYENETTEISEQLVRGPDQLQIISIFGMPGLGKTTLAKKLYNDPSIVYHFDKRAWCVVSQTYNKRNMLIDILRSMSHLKRETITKMDDESLAQNLYKSLKGTRYLIVIDDIWDTESWDDLKRYFPDDGTRSRVIFTTRNKEVGLKASPHSVVNALPFLSEEECWELLQCKVFQKEYCPQELLEVGKEIAGNCQGLPLTVIVIAAVLANMKKEKQLWLDVARRLSSYISENPNECIHILELSYKHLPMHLKPCFLYFGTFEEDREIPVRKLISLWVAEGFIKKEGQESLENVAEEYLMVLIDRSLVFVAERRSDGGVKTCVIHDLMRDMCLRIAEEENFLKAIEDRVSMYQKHHRLIINGEARQTYSLPFGLHIRSLLYTSYEQATLISSSFKVLRVLDSSERSQDFMDVIGIELLVHLRYLAVPCTQLPLIESLHKLEYLFVGNTEEVEIPEILFNMVSLRHVYFSGGAYFSASCRQQATKDESFQINNIQSISLLTISDKIDEKILRCSPNLHKLKGRVGSSLNHSFDFLNQLESLTLSVYDGEKEDSRSHLFSLPLTLKKLSLDNVHVSPEQIEIIGRLPNLEVLKLEDAVLEGEQWDASEAEFPQLIFLKLDNVLIAEWNASSDNFPRLERLVLQHCRHLKMIPSSLGDIPTLQMIEVYRCAQDIEESAMQIQEEQEENGNEELKVIIYD